MVIAKAPIDASLITFLVLSALFVVTTPFIPDISRSAYLLGGIAYSMFLAACSVGFMLLGPKIAKPVFFSTIAVVAFLILAEALPLWLLSERAMAVLGWVQPVGLSVACLTVFVFVAASFYGWVRHYRSAR